jgi:beta-glucosidase
VKVKNIGTRGSDEVVQMYVQHLGSSVDRPHLELKGFERVHIGPGEEKTVVFELKPHDLADWDAARHDWRIEKEPVRVLAGGSSDNLPLQATLQIETEGEYKP